MKKLTILSLGLLACLSLSATALPPGGTLLAPIASGSATTPFTLSIASSYSANGGTATGSLVQAVTHIGGSTYDFYYQIVSNVGSTSSITSFLLRGFAGFTVDATQISSNPGAPFSNPASGVNPFAVTRSGGSGADISAVYSPFGVGPVAPATSPVSTILRLRVTDATGFTALMLPNGGTINGSLIGLQLAPTPEPSFYVAVSVGLAGLFMARRRKASNQV